MSGDVTPRVSVVVPSYNNASFIEATMDSILAQTFEDFELVVADHSSADGTWERLQRYRTDPRVRLLRTETGGGAPRNWERVTAAARGELLKLVCGDDIIYPDCLRDAGRGDGRQPFGRPGGCPTRPHRRAAAS